MVHKSFCNKSNMKPKGDIRDCNQKPCPPPVYAMFYKSYLKKNAVEGLAVQTVLICPP